VNNLKTCTSGCGCFYKDCYVGE